MATPFALLLNPNSSTATSEMMLGIARRAAGDALAVEVATARRNPPMIVTAEQLAAAGDEVVEIGTVPRPGCVGIVVSAFGDPGLAALAARVAVPVVGLCEAAMLEAARDGRRFAVATVTPDLAGPIAGRARDLGLAKLYTGIRCTEGDPLLLTRDPEQLREGLAEAVRVCIEVDGAEAVIIGGGPLGQAAESLQPRFATPVIAPIPAAIRLLLARRAGPLRQAS